MEESALPPAPELILPHIEQNMVPLGCKWKKWCHSHTADLCDLKFGMQGFLMMPFKPRWIHFCQSVYLEVWCRMSASVGCRKRENQVPLDDKSSGLFVAKQRIGQPLGSDGLLTLILESRTQILTYGVGKMEKWPGENQTENLPFRKQASYHWATKMLMVLSDTFSLTLQAL